MQVNVINSPQFSDINPSEIPKTLNGILKANRAKLKSLLSQKKFTWDNLLKPLEMMETQLHNFWSVISHLNGVKNNASLRKAYQACLPALSKYSTDLSHNEKLYRAILAIKRTQYKKLNQAQKAIIEHELLNFKLSGVNLPPKKKKRFSELCEKLSKLSNQFSNNVLDATHAWFKQVEDKKLLSGIPKHAIDLAKQQANLKKLKGWVFTLDLPSYIAVMTYADSRELRQEMYFAYTTRASDQGPNKGKHYNTLIMQSILKIRLELAKLLGFKNYAEYSLASKMVKKTKTVITFLNDLVKHGLSAAKKEFKKIKELAKKNNIEDIQPWDVAYYSEKLKKVQFNISDEMLRPYFPEDKVVDGLFKIIFKLFKVTIKSIQGLDIWNKDVKVYGLYNNTKNLMGIVYFDLYARTNKRAGAWMDECRTRQMLDENELQLPIAFINCNFNPPVGRAPALLSHDDVLTLFHEFGHATQHLLTQMKYADVSGLNGIPWDAVEIASQFLENYAWQKSCLKLISKHYKTGKMLPGRLFNQSLKAKNFQSAMQMIRQLEFSLFDFRLHMEFNPKIKNQIQKILDQVRNKISVIPQASFDRFQNSFSHIFSGGYAAGYYSYKWSEMMSADIFDLFHQKGLFNAKISQRYLNTFLAKGGSEEPEILFKRFRGRAPNIKALLKDQGIIK